jgi:ribulose 1,5-bisphosphate synthetase/thiazole synthase
LDASADIVVAGAGHNSLVAGCYLAKAGYRCLVLDARHIPGGGAATEELMFQPLCFTPGSCRAARIVDRAASGRGEDAAGLFHQHRHLVRD